NHNLDELARRYLNHTTTKIGTLIGTGKNQKCMDEVPVAEVAAYAGEDADVPLRLKPMLEKKLAEQELNALFHDVELPLVGVLGRLECLGIKIDVDRLAELSERYTKRLEELEKELYELAGCEFNIASPKQLQKILFEDHCLPVISRTKTGPSTDA